MTTKQLQFGDTKYFDALPVLEKDPKKSHYERKLRENAAMQEFKKESFGLLQKKGKISKKNTKLIDPIDITTLFHTWNNDNGEYGGKRKTKKKRPMKKTRLMKKSRKLRK
jgi:hypothetical protein